MWVCPSQTWSCILRWLWSWQQAEVGLGRKGETFWRSQRSRSSEHACQGALQTGCMAQAPVQLLLASCGQQDACRAMLAGRVS